MTLLRAHALRCVRLVEPLRAAHGVWDGCSAETACFGGLTPPKRVVLGWAGLLYNKVQMGRIARHQTQDGKLVSGLPKVHAP